MIDMTQSDEQRIPQLTLGFRMQMSMRKAGLSRAEIADRMHVTGSTVGRWMSDKDKTGVKAIYLERWAELCDVPYKWLVGELFVDPTVEAANPTPTPRTSVPHPRRRATDITDDSTGSTRGYQDASLACRMHDVRDLLLAS